MPTKLKQHMNTLYNKGQSLRDDTHCDLRHHHVAGVYLNGRCLSWGYNHKSCLLSGFNGRKSATERRRRYRQTISFGKNITRRSRRYHKNSHRPKTPITHVLPNYYPSKFKAKLCRNVKTMRKL